jgi:hypothetical protein
MSDGIQLEVNGVNLVATTESPRNKIIEEASKNGELTIIMVIPGANLNECSNSFHIGSQHDFRQAPSKM